jgi:hypothetical protein
MCWMFSMANGPAHSFMCAHMEETVVSRAQSTAQPAVLGQDRSSGIV